ncbi:MAG TPA: DUF4124 domain-containing protein [Fontimonas sp.]
MIRCLVLLALLLAGPALADEVYKQVQPDGSIRYTDKPPSKGAKPAKLPPLSGTIGAGASSPGARVFYTEEALREAARFAVSIESPTPGQEFRIGADRAVAAANVMPGLVTGFGLMYYLDGAAMTQAPVDKLSVLMPLMAAGPHKVSVAVLDARGREVARSAETDFIVSAPK